MQERRGEAAAVEEGVDRVEQGEPLPHGHRGPARRPRLLPPLPYPAPRPGRHRPVARLHHLRDLVRHLLDPRPVPQVVPHRPRDLPRPPLAQVSESVSTDIIHPSRAPDLPVDSVPAWQL